MKPQQSANVTICRIFELKRVKKKQVRKPTLKQQQILQQLKITI